MARRATDFKIPVMTAADATQAPTNHPSSLQITTEIVSALLAAAGLVYVLGGFIVGLQLWTAGVPAIQAAVAPLPREYAITVALSGAIGPGVLTGLVGVGVLLSWRRPIEHDAFSFHRKPLPDVDRTRHAVKLKMLMVAATVAVLTPGMLVATLNRGVDFTPRHALAVVIALLTAAVAVLVARMLLNHVFCNSPASPVRAQRRLNVPPVERLGQRPRRKLALGEEYLAERSLLRIGAALALLGMVAAVIAIGARELPRVQVFQAGSAPVGLPGRLIGQSASKTYLAVTRGRSTTVVAIRDDQIVRIVIGD